jgi:hypothetical protein
MNITQMYESLIAGETTLDQFEIWIWERENMASYYTSCALHEQTNELEE